MQTKCSGSIAADHAYCAREIASILGGSEQSWKSWIRENVKHCEPFEGLLIVSGRLLIAAIETASDHDTDEDKERRRHRAGVTRRQANQDEPSDDPLWTPTRVAQHLSITTATLRTYASRYGMRSLGNGKARRYRRSEVERVMAMRESGE